MRPRRKLDAAKDHLRFVVRKKILDIFRKHAEETIEQLSSPLYATICDGLYEAAKIFMARSAEREPKSAEEFPFYVWPGYDSIKRYNDGQVPRIHITTSLRQRAGSGLSARNRFEDIKCGISPAYKISTLWRGVEKRLSTSERTAYTEQNFEEDLQKLCTVVRKKSEGPNIEVPGLTSTWNGKERVFRLLGTPSSIIFSVLLESKQKGKFSPGSTHQWLVANDNQTDGLSIFYCADKLLARGFVRRYCQVGLKSAMMRRAGEHISKSLQALGPGTETLSVWPEPLREPGEQTYPTNLGRHLLARLYSPWLMSVFTPEQILATGSKRDGSKAIWEEFFDKDDRLEVHKQLGNAFEHGVGTFRTFPPAFQAMLLDWGKYNHWVSLALNDVPASIGNLRAETKAVEEDELMAEVADEFRSLGSIMIFSQRKLDIDFLAIVRDWLQEIFLLFRLHEATQLSERQGEAEEAESINRVLSHEYKKILPLIKICKPWMRDQIHLYLFTFALPRWEELREEYDKKLLPPELYGNPKAYGDKEPNYDQWIRSLFNLAAGIEAMTAFAESRLVAEEESLWRDNVTRLYEGFDTHGLNHLHLPRGFKERCIFGTTIVVVLRNCLKHTTDSYPKDVIRRDDAGRLCQDAEYGIIKFTDDALRVCGNGKIIRCSVNSVPDQHSSRPGRREHHLVFSNPTSATERRGLGGTSHCVNYYLKEIAKANKRKPYKFALPTKTENGIYHTLLPLLS